MIKKTKNQIKKKEKEKTKWQKIIQLMKRQRY